MADGGAEPAQLHDLVRCLNGWRLTTDIAVASAALIFYDWILTSGGELDYLWRRERLTYARVLFVLARYPALACALLDLFPSSVTQGNVLTCLRLATIVFSELILATRTWAIWEKSRAVLAVLVGTFVACAAPGIAIIERDIATTVLGPSADPGLADVQQCQVFTSAVKHVWVVPYLVVMVFEAVVLALTLYRVLAYYREVPKQTRTPLLDVLWIDGVMYFVFMLLLGVMNVVLVLQVSDPQLRTGGTQLQMVLHSILSTRIVLHIAHTTQQDLVDSRCTLAQYRISTAMEFANVSEVTAEAVVLDDEPALGAGAGGVEPARRGKDPVRAV
ncbi:hypothetical protein BC834DRAFT_967434 [Gloeopeniophorella convolvens]|nr:hypothetical protein BC834DRAFT_967434 [Gloeopeniophorella convolvens]